MEPDGTEPPILGDFRRLTNAAVLTPLAQVSGYRHVSGLEVFEYPLTLRPNERVICVLERLTQEVRVCRNHTDIEFCVKGFRNGRASRIAWYVGVPDSLTFE